MSLIVQLVFGYVVGNTVPADRVQVQVDRDGDQTMGAQIDAVVLVT